MGKESKITVAQQDYSGDTGLTWGAMPPARRHVPPTAADHTSPPHSTANVFFMLIALSLCPQLRDSVWTAAAVGQAMTH